MKLKDVNSLLKVKEEGGQWYLVYNNENVYEREGMVEISILHRDHCNYLTDQLPQALHCIHPPICFDMIQSRSTLQFK